MTEEWRDIKGYEGLYQVSNLGRVRSLDRIVSNPSCNSKIKRIKGVYLKLQKDKGGYTVVSLSKDSKTKLCKVHRLVAGAFLDNPNNLPQVNHRNEVKSDNRVENLEWCDAKYNINYGTLISRLREKQFKPVVCLDKNGNFIQEYPSILEAANDLNCCRSKISAVCKGQRKTTGGYKWVYKYDAICKN